VAAVGALLLCRRENVLELEVTEPRTGSRQVVITSAFTVTEEDFLTTFTECLILLSVNTRLCYVCKYIKYKLSLSHIHHTIHYITLHTIFNCYSHKLVNCTYFQKTRELCVLLQALSVSNLFFLLHLFPWN
jgi:hypothetical protein